jgi:hypothetical protein
MARTNVKKEAAPHNGTETVTVALKHPTGIVLEVFEKKSMAVPDGRGAMRDEPMFRSTGKQFPINGTRVPFGKAPKFPIVGGYALTQGVPKDVWDKWLEQHHDHPLVENELITAFPQLDMAQDFAEEHKDLRSGMEPLLQKGDPRTPKTQNREGKFVDAIEHFDGQAA